MYSHYIPLHCNWRLTIVARGLSVRDVAVCIVEATNTKEEGWGCVEREVETAVNCEGFEDAAELGEENKLVCRAVV